MEIPRIWRLNLEMKRFTGYRCPHCDYKIFPRRNICPGCGENTSTVIVYEAPNSSFAKVDAASSK